jgi:hypothetical protein
MVLRVRKEMPMPRQDRPHHAVQLDLFRPAGREPDWRRLPLEVREQARLLLAQMFRMGPVQSGAGEAERVAGDE